MAPATRHRQQGVPRSLWQIVALLFVAAVASAGAAGASQVPQPQQEVAVDVDGSTGNPNTNDGGSSHGTQHQQQQTVVVLGSGGFLGRALTRQLRALDGVRVVEVRNRAHYDLRQPGSLAAALADAGAPAPDFIFFLACEVGGAKYLESNSSTIQAGILAHNWAMYETVFPAAAALGARLLFTSSYLRHLPWGAYAGIKRVGEEWARQHAGARIVRLWNLYGAETPSIKSHVVSDWVAQCVHTGAIVSATDAAERRQLLHIEDAAAALVATFRHWDTIFTDGGASDATLRTHLDISSGVWLRLADVARMIDEEAAALGLRRCAFRPAAGTVAPPRPEVDPGTRAWGLGAREILLWHHTYCSMPHPTIADTTSALFQEWRARVVDPRPALAGTDGWDADLAATTAHCDGTSSPCGDGAGYIGLRAGIRQLLRFHTSAP